MNIQYQRSSSPVLSPVFSILIPTWNNLAFVKLCVESIQKNSTYAHQIVLHLNDGHDGTLEWAKQQGLDFSYSPQNVGICYACNAAASLAMANYILYMNDDMYACPNWDKNLWQAIKEYGQDDFYFSATMIEREASDWGCVAAPHNYGHSVESFQEAALLADYQKLAIPDWQGANYPPSVMHRRMWQLIGGFSVEFSPGMYSDPDICRKLWAAGVRNFRGVGSSLVYHFMSKSIGRVQKNDGARQFFRKWGISSRTFFDFYLRFYNHGRDSAYKGILAEPVDNQAFRFKKIKDRVKYWF